MHHQESCREVKFNADGSVLLSASADRSIGVLDVGTGKLLTRISDAHDFGLSAMATAGTLVATGDDDGVVKGWDLRQKMKPIWSFDKCQSDYISDLLFVPEKHTLLSTSGDGSLAAFHTRKGTEINLSDDSGNDEPLCICLAHAGRFVATGQQDGHIKLWKWGEWAFETSTFAGHPASVDCMLAVDEETYVTGSSDGLIRLITILPNNLLGVIGHHQTFPIEALALCREQRFLASAAHDKTIRFWNISDYSSDDDAADEADKDQDSRPAPPVAHPRLAKTAKNKGAFFDGL